MRKNKFKIYYRHDDLGITSRIIELGQLIPELGERWSVVARCQFTGLMVKNVELYEDDIVRMNARGTQGYYDGVSDGEEFDIDYTGQVVILPSRGVCLKEPRWVDGIDGPMGQCSSYKQVRAYRSEIIGNIWEHPELLTATQADDD